MRRLNYIILIALIGGITNASIVIQNVNQTASVGGTTSVQFSMTGGTYDSFSFEISGYGPYPNWEVALTTGGDGFLNASQIAMANGYHALLGTEEDVASQSSWTGGNLAWGSKFFTYGETDPNGWANSTGYVGLRYKHFVDGVGTVYNYGWAEFSFTQTPDPEVRSFTVVRYAYETDYNTAIITPVPEPATMPMLVLFVAVGMMIRRWFGE